MTGCQKAVEAPRYCLTRQASLTLATNSGSFEQAVVPCSSKQDQCVCEGRAPTTLGCFLQTPQLEPHSCRVNKNKRTLVKNSTALRAACCL